MSWIEALILGIVQGLTEFLPVSSSGHLEIGKVLLGVETEKNLLFTLAVHGATVLSTIIVFRKDILQILKGVFEKSCNEEKRFFFLILISMIPVLIVGLFWKDKVESMFTGNMLLVGISLIITASLLLISTFSKTNNKEIGLGHAVIIGFAQALAVIPGISRSGATIATGLLLGNQKEKVARFSFLMVIIPILGANFLDISQTDFSQESSVSGTAILIGFISAFIAGLLACSWMIKLVKNGKLTGFAIYCFVIGSIAILSTIL